MGDVYKEIREIQMSILADMKKRRELLDIGIAKLEHVIDNPTLPPNIDFGVTEGAANRDKKKN